MTGTNPSVDELVGAACYFEALATRVRDIATRVYAPRVERMRRDVNYNGMASLHRFHVLHESADDHQETAEDLLWYALCLEDPNGEPDMDPDDGAERANYIRQYDLPECRRRNLVTS